MYMGENIRINVKDIGGMVWSGLVWFKWPDLALNLPNCNRPGIS
jgi:hypothetical protein